MLGTKRRFGAIDLTAVAEIIPLRNDAGELIEETIRLPRGTKRNKYTNGPFCRFKVAGAIKTSGVYAITSGSELKYVGQCENLGNRFGAGGYGSISPRNCHSDGQSTNCKVNSLILREHKAGRALVLWFIATAHYKQVESELIRQMNPPWNGRLEVRLALPPASKSQSAARPRRPKLPAAAKQQAARQPGTAAAKFRDALQSEFLQAQAKGEPQVCVRAADLHRAVGGYPGPNHRMPICCSVMRKLMVAEDSVVQTPPKGAGASLTIAYKLPRPGAADALISA